MPPGAGAHRQRPGPAGPRGGLRGPSGEQLALATHPTQPNADPPVAPGGGGRSTERAVDRTQITQADGVGRKSDQKVRAEVGCGGAPERYGFDRTRFSVSPGLTEERSEARRGA